MHTDMATMPVGRLLVLTGRLVANRFQRLLESEGLTDAGWFVLNRLAEQDGMLQREVAERCFVRAATTTGVVDTLERDGLVRRERGRDDRRVVRLYLTDAGRERLARARRRVEAESAEVFGDVTAREEAVVRRFLIRTMSRLGDVPADDHREAR